MRRAASFAGSSQPSNVRHDRPSHHNVMQGGKLSSFVMPVIRASFRRGKMLFIPMSNRPSLTFGKQGGKLAKEARLTS